jgi:hypothetical protein
VTTPYDYTEGYHFLMKHLRSRYVCVFPSSVFFLSHKVLKKTTYYALCGPLPFSDPPSSPYKCLFLSTTRCL